MKTSNFHKYMSKAHVDALQHLAEDPLLLTCGYMDSLFPSPYSVSAFSSTISRKKTMATSSPCFWPLIKKDKISGMPIFETSLVASLGMAFFGPKVSGQKNTSKLNYVGLQLQSRDDDDGRCFLGVELEAEEDMDEAKRENDGQRRRRNSTGHKSLGDTPKLLLAGAVSTIISRTFVAPLERLKLEYVVRGAKDDWFKTFYVIWVSEGFAGFWKGNTLNLLRMVPFKTINFVVYDMHCNWLLKLPGKEEITNSDRLAAGAVSGIAATILCLPMDTIRTRLVAPGGETLGGIVGCFQHMVHTEGFLSLYKGLIPTLLSMVPAGAVFYGVYDILKAAYLSSPKGQEQLRQRIEDERQKKQTLKGDINTEEKDNSKQMELGAVRTLAYGAIAGACAETVTYPLEVIRRQLQLQETTNLGLLATFSSIVQRGGAKALFAGVFPSTMQVLPSAALSYLIYEFMKVLLKIP